MIRWPNNNLSTKLVTATQLNCIKKGYTIYALLNEYQHDTDILLLQEPR